MSNLIDRQKLIDALIGLIPFAISDKATEAYSNGLTDAYNLICAQPDFDITVKIDKAYDDGYEAGYLQGRHDWGDLDE